MERFRCPQTKHPGRIPGLPSRVPDPGMASHRGVLPPSTRPRPVMPAKAGSSFRKNRPGPGRRYPALAGLVLVLMCTAPARAVLDFKEVTAVSVAVEAIYLKGRNDFFILPGEEGQLAAKTRPAALKDKVRWAIVAQNGDLEVQLDPASGLLIVSKASGTGWATVEATAEGCPPKTQRIDIGCPCPEAGGTCEAPVGAGEVIIDSLAVRLSLGKLAGGRSAGDLFLYAEEPLAILSTPEALVVNSSSDQVTPFYQGGILEQILTPQAIVVFIRFSSIKYEIHFYDAAHRGQALEDGRYSIDPAATPIAVWRFENPDASGEAIGELAITERRGGETRAFFYRYEADEHSWTLISGNGLKIASKSETTSKAGDRVVRTQVADPDGKPVQVKETVYRKFAFGEKRIRETVDPAGHDLTTRYRYHSDPGPGYGKLAARLDSDGGWVRYRYDAEGRIAREVRPYLGASIETADGRVVSVDNSYAPVDPVDGDAVQDRHRPRQVIENTAGIETGRRYYAYITEDNGTRIEIVERCTAQGRPYGHPANLRTVTSYYSSGGDGPEAGRIKRRLTPDGRLTTYTYANGSLRSSFDPVRWRFIPGKGRAIRTTITHGSMGHPEGIPLHTTRQTNIRDAMGREKLQETYVRTRQGFSRIDWRLNTHDRSGRVIETLSANGTRTETTWGCCGKLSETDAGGITTRYAYDDLERMTARTNEATGVVTSFTYDAAGRRLSTTQSKDVYTLTWKRRYDSAGRLSAQVDAAGLVTRYEHAATVTTTIKPGGVTEITTRHLDGRIRSLTGTGVVPRYYRYGVAADGCQWTTVFIGSGRPALGADHAGHGRPRHRGGKTGF